MADRPDMHAVVFGCYDVLLKLIPESQTDIKAPKERRNRQGFQYTTFYNYTPNSNISQ